MYCNIYQLLRQPDEEWTDADLLSDHPLLLIFCPLSSLYLELLVLINNHERIVLRTAGNP